MNEQTQPVKTAGESGAPLEKRAPSANGMGVFLLNLALLFSSVALIVLAGDLGETQIIIFSVILLCVSSVIFFGFRILKPNEAYVLTLFGKYYGTLSGAGFYFINPFCSAINPATATLASATGRFSESSISFGRKISLKPQTLSNDKQKINDSLGNPIIIGMVVIWKIEDTAAAVFGVDNYKEYLSISCDAALRDIVRMYPYDSANMAETTLRGGAKEISEKLREEIQKKTRAAGLHIQEATITHLSYAPEIASAMLQRQKAKALIDAKQLIADGAADIVSYTVEKIAGKNICELTNDKKAQIIANLLTVLCASQDTQPIINAGEN